MTQDFAKKPRRKTPRSPKKKPRAKSQIPGWVWLFTGTVLGAFIMFLSYLSDLPESEQMTAKPKIAAPAAKPKPAKTDPSAIPKPRFDFYQLLEEDKVEAPRSDNKPSSRATAKTAEPIEYLMQVGSFKQPDDADRLRAELLMMNLDVNIEEFKKRNNDRYFRVLVGPYASRNTMSKDRSTLAGNNIDVWVITRKTEG